MNYLNLEQIEELFEAETWGDDKHPNAIDFDEIPSKFSNCRYVHALTLLSRLFPDQNTIAGASHDEIYLDFTIYNLDGKITEGQLWELRACGVMLWEDEEHLYMFA